MNVINETPFWTPAQPETSQLSNFMEHLQESVQQSFPDYQSLYHWSLKEPASFWQAVAQYFHFPFTHPAHTILQPGKNLWDAQWFVGAQTNIAQAFLKRHDKQPAIIAYDERGRQQSISFHELTEAVHACRTGLQKLGVNAGDRVAALLPNTPYAIIAMIACASLGAIWCVASPEFGHEALLPRFEQITPKILISCDGYRYAGKIFSCEEKINYLLEKIPSIQHTVICPVLDIPMSASFCTWNNLLSECHITPFQSFPFNHPLYILFSSGTTGKPKCILHSAGGTLLQHYKELGLHTNIKPNERMMFYTTCGWMMWHWSVSSLALGATLVIYDGAPLYPDGYHLFQILEKEKVQYFGTSAKFLSTIAKESLSPIDHYRFPHLRTILSTGSPLLSKQYDFVAQHIKPGIQLSSISGGSDIISCFALGNPLLPIYPGELTSLGLGMAVEIWDANGHPLKGTPGDLVCTKAHPAMPLGFWNDPDKTLYKKTYFDTYPNVWRHGDYAEITRHQGLIIYGRSDSTLNPGGVRIGSAEIYKPLESLTEIADCVVIGLPCDDDVQIILFVQLSPNTPWSEQLGQKIKRHLFKEASPRHVPAQVIPVQDIPRTMNGKTMEVAVRQAVLGEPIPNVSAIANPESLNYFKNILCGSM
ncbi:MAG: acetoacetate--CoA ligase, partial [Legionellaceae bacterium]|nr:acetoacetate--CoA ligase [Legionellaceae bacterium]